MFPAVSVIGFSPQGRPAAVAGATRSLTKAQRKIKIYRKGFCKSAVEAKKPQT
jgi:hypothetical protein